MMDNPNATDGPMDISVVVPALDAAGYLPRLLLHIELQSLPPREIVIVDSSRDRATEELVRNWWGAVPILYHRLDFAYPGHARNAGVALATGHWIAFLDCRTIPARNWLTTYAAQVSEQDIDFVPGLFTTEADSHFKRILLAATYGNASVVSLPGALVRKELFERSGGFVPGARAGEDVEWMARLASLGVRKGLVARPLLVYQGLPASLGAAVWKWYVYAVANRHVNIRIYQKFLYGALLFSTSLLFIYNWNFLFAHWKESSVFYVPNITKLFLAVICLAYCVSQGFVKPLRKKVEPSFLLPFNWLLIVGVRICLDLAKAPGMTIGAVLQLRNQLLSLCKLSDEHRYRG